MDFDLNIFLSTLPSLLRGAVVTIKLAGASLALALIIGSLGGIARLSSQWPLRWAAAIYVTVVRGVPLLMTLLFLYYGLPSAGIILSATTVGILALSITAGAYITEIVRAGIQSIDRGQMRAARSLGMSYSLAMRRVILPQTFRRVLPPITNEAITVVKNTALVSVIAISDLLRAGMEAMSWQANTFSPFAGVALIYLALTLPLIGFNSWLERRYRIV
jgi:His/Glu/Gln/Arg/opine family amino acid ABC transporter permease subunit